MKLSIIVAQSRNRVIGHNNTLPWRLPKDLQYFKAVTLNKPVIMGRKTYESIGRPLPNRTNIVLTSDVSLQIEGVVVVNTLGDAIEQAKQVCLRSGAEEVIVMGGAQIYAQAIDITDKLYVTEVDAEIQGDAFFPLIDKNKYKKISEIENFSDEVNQYNYSFVVYEKAIYD